MSLTPAPALALCGWKSAVRETVEKQVLIELREDRDGLLKGPIEGSEGEQEREDVG